MEDLSFTNLPTERITKNIQIKNKTHEHTDENHMETWASKAVVELLRRSSCEILDMIYLMRGMKYECQYQRHVKSSTICKSMPIYPKGLNFTL